MMIDSLKTSFKDETTLLKAKENQYKEIDDTFQDNSSILNLISSYLMFDADLNDVANTCVTALRTTKHLDTHN